MIYSPRSVSKTWIVTTVSVIILLLAGYNPLHSATMPTSMESRSLITSDANEEDLDTLVRWMTGDFVNSMQHQRDTTVPLMKLEIRELDSTSAGDRRLDIVMHSIAETAIDSLHWHMQIHRLEEGMIECKPFIVPGQNTSMVGCEWYLQYSGSSFLGGSHGYACTSIPNVAYVTTEIEIRDFGIKIWVRGYNSNREQIFGPTKGPLLFGRAITAKQ